MRTSRLVPALLAVSVALTLAQTRSTSTLTPGARVLLDAHNCYPEADRWADRIDRALATGLPVAIEQDLVWYADPATGKARSIVSHGEPFTGREPSLEDPFLRAHSPAGREGAAPRAVARPGRSSCSTSI